MFLLDLCLNAYINTFFMFWFHHIIYCPCYILINHWTHILLKHYCFHLQQSKTKSSFSYALCLCLCRSRGKWSTDGCVTLGGNFVTSQGVQPYVNCSCSHLSTFGVLMDITDKEVSFASFVTCTLDTLCSWDSLVSEHGWTENNLI